MKKNPHKLTHTIDKELKDLAQALPVITLLNSKGQVILDFKDVQVSWEDLTPAQRKDHPVKEWKNDFKMVGNNKIYTGTQSEVKYSVRHSWPRTQNHYIALVFKYKDYGMPGVEAYVQNINNITEQSIATAQKQVLENQNEGKQLGEV